MFTYFDDVTNVFLLLRRSDAQLRRGDIEETEIQKIKISKKIYVTMTS